MILNLFGNQYYRALFWQQPTPIKGTEWFWAIGVLVTLFGATLTVVGFMVQKQSHSEEAAAVDGLGRSGAPSRPYWMQSRWLLGEPVSTRTAASALLLACGTGWVVFSGPKVYQ